MEILAVENGAYIPTLIPLDAQALFAPTKEWERAAIQLKAIESARPKLAHAASEVARL